MGRLARSHLVERAPATRLVEVVRGVCGIHAQVMGSAELQLAARVDGITQADVRRALWEERSLAKTWTLRGTLHIHPADELALWTAARRAVVGEGDGEPGERELVTELVAAIGDALRGRRLTREELADAVLERVPSAPREQLASGWGFYLGDAAEAGLLCFGPPEGARVTFVHTEDWLGSQRAWEPRDALLEVARRYAAAYGPVTYRHFREWCASRSATVAVARDVLAAVEQPSVEPDTAERSIRLLPEYDAYVMAVRDRDALVPPAVRAQVAAHGKGRYEGPAGTPFLLVDGVCAGVWRRKRSGKRIELTVEPARKLTRAERAGVAEEGARIGTFLGIDASLALEPSGAS